MTLTDKQLQFEQEANVLRKAASKYLQRSRALQAHEIEDLVQSALLRAWEQLDSWQGTSELRTWFIRITINESKMYLRNRKREVSEIPEAIEHHALPTQERSLALREFLESLTPKSRLVFTRYLEGLSFAEIGRMLGHSPEWAKKIYQRALEAWK